MSFLNYFPCGCSWRVYRLARLLLRCPVPAALPGPRPAPPGPAARPAPQEARGRGRDSPCGRSRYPRVGRGPSAHPPPLPPSSQRPGCTPRAWRCGAPPAQAGGSSGATLRPRRAERRSPVPGSSSLRLCPSAVQLGWEALLWRWGGTGRGAEAALCCSHQQLQKGLSRALFLLSQCQTSFQLNIFFRQFSSSDWTKGNLRPKPLFCCCCICFRDCGYLLRGACSSTSTPADGDFQGHRSASLKEVRSPLECFAVQI